jgi:hypothetical protein
VEIQEEVCLWYEEKEGLVVGKARILSLGFCASSI